MLTTVFVRKKLSFITKLVFSKKNKGELKNYQTIFKSQENLKILFFKHFARTVLMLITKVTNNLFILNVVKRLYFIALLFIILQLKPSW